MAKHSHGEALSKSITPMTHPQGKNTLGEKKHSECSHLDQPLSSQSTLMAAQHSETALSLQNTLNAAAMRVFCLESVLQKMSFSGRKKDI